MDGEGQYHRKKPRAGKKKCAQIELLKQFTNSPTKTSA